MTDRERAIREALSTFGWAIVDPWSAVLRGGVWAVEDAGPVCPVCGRGAPLGENWPTAKTFCDPANHDDDCAFASLLKDDH